MKTILITGHDTGIGKTYITRYIAKKLSDQKQHVQVVKAVETGIQKNTQDGDVATVLKNLPLQYLTGFTLNSFEAPLAPLQAAALENHTLTLEALYNQFLSLPPTYWRLIETAGGIAVPLDPNGQDTRDLALKLNIDHTVLVIQNRLGAINQSRLLQAYIPQKFQSVGLWLNNTTPIDPRVTQSNLHALHTLKTPLWAHTNFLQLEPDFCTAPFLS